MYISELIQEDIVWRPSTSIDGPETVAQRVDGGTNAAEGAAATTSETSRHAVMDARKSMIGKDLQRTMLNEL